MTLEALLALLDYHYWARDRLLDAVEEITPDHFHKEYGEQFSLYSGHVASLRVC